MTDPGPSRNRGTFIALEGPDGGGKTTQASRLVERLRSLGREVVPCRDPGGTALGDRLRSILLDRSNIPISMRSEMLLYMASRAQLVEEIIRPALDAGKVVVTDRYLLSNVVYQGYAGGLDVADLWQIGKVATGGLMPDLTLILDVPREVARERGVGAGRDRIEDRPDSYRQAVRDGFLAAAPQLHNRCVIIDAGHEPDVVAARIMEEVERALALDPWA